MCVAVLATHGQVKSKRIAVNDIHVARFRTSESVDPTTEGPIGVDVDNDAGVFTMNCDYNQKTRLYKITYGL